MHLIYILVVTDNGQISYRWKTGEESLSDGEGEKPVDEDVLWQAKDLIEKKLREVGNG